MQQVHISTNTPTMTEPLPLSRAVRRQLERLERRKPTLDPVHFCDELPDDDEGELPDSLYDAIDAFNAAVEKAGPLSWSPGKFALDLTDMTANAELCGGPSGPSERAPG